MKRAFLYGILGAGLAILPCYGAISSQTDWLDEPAVIASDYEPLQVETIMVEPEPIIGSELVGMTHTRSAEIITTSWWEARYVNDPDIPDDIEEAAYIYGEMFNICPEFLEAICNKETGGTYRCDMIDSTGLCYGPMQIHITAQKKRMEAFGLHPEDMLTADGGMIVAASYVAELFDKYEDPAVVLMKYNGASTALKEYRKTGELNYYTEYVLRLSQELEEKHKTLDEERTKG